jgi:carboxypeptidase family protein
VKKDSCKNSSGGKGRSAVLGPGCSAWLSLGVLLCGVPALARPQQPPIAPATSSGPSDGRGVAASAGEPSPNPQSSAGISGIVVDQAGSAVAGASVRITREDQAASQEVLSGADGQFSFDSVAPGPFQLSVTFAGFTTQVVSGILRPGEIQVVPEISLAVAAAVTEVQVVLPRVEMAEAELKEEEKQRMLGVIPNFYVSYVPDAVPLNTRQKFELAWKTTVDPVSLGLIGVTAGAQQAANNFSRYGQGAQGFGKRYGAALADSATSTFIGGAILPSLLKQDPRYFYKGTGSKRSRILYALANAVICKGDNGRWQANYSGFFGGLASGAISTVYYPPEDRGAGLVFENLLIGIGESAVTNLFQEFVVRRLTPNHANSGPTKSDK